MLDRYVSLSFTRVVQHLPTGGVVIQEVDPNVVFTGVDIGTDDGVEVGTDERTEHSKFQRVRQSYRTKEKTKSCGDCVYPICISNI